MRGISRPPCYGGLDEAAIKFWGARTIAFPTDVREDGVRARADAAFGAFGNVHVLCTNAAMGRCLTGRTRCREATRRILRRAAGALPPRLASWPELPPVRGPSRGLRRSPEAHEDRRARPTQPAGCFQRGAPRDEPFGLRSGERELEAAPGTFRIAVIGDSLVMGEAVPEHARCTDLLEKMLNEEAKDARRYEIMNLGLSGINLSVAVDRLETIGLQFHPDLLIYGFTISDIEGPHYRRFEGGTVPVLPVFAPTSRL